MGTRLDIVFPGVESGLVDHVMQQVSAELIRIERKLSLYDPDSDISLINTTGHAGPVSIDQELHGIFREILSLNQETKGYFDITLKPVHDFHSGNDAGNLPVPRNIRDVIGLDKVSLSQEGIMFRKKGIIIDLGGYGKGFAIKRLLEILHASGIESALISFGESLVYGLGSHPYGDTWKISLPLEGPSGDPVTFDLKNNALSTSGNSLNNQKKFANLGHIVNPVTLQVNHMQGSVSVKTADPIRAEVFSTALFSAGPEDSEELLELDADLEVRWILPV
jgi:thiamine biosynthesis lipoprotein